VKANWLTHITVAVTDTADTTDRAATLSARHCIAYPNYSISLPLVMIAVGPEVPKPQGLTDPATGKIYDRMQKANHTTKPRKATTDK